MNGFFCINKPFGISSAKVVWMIKKKFNLKDKIGHMGTLDPFATGVLVIGVGRANRLFNYMLEKRKTYITTFDFGYETETLDLESENIIKKTTNIPSKEEIQNQLKKMIGKSKQVAPSFSAKNINGTRAYMLAREGKTAEIKPHEIEIYSFKILSQNSSTSFNFKIECSGGTYIRSICRDLAYALNSVATMTKLMRSKCGNFSIENSKNVDNITESDLIDCEFVLENMQELKLSEKQIKDLKDGKKLVLDCDGGLFKVFSAGNIVGIAKCENGIITMPTWLV